MLRQTRAKQKLSSQLQAHRWDWWTHCVRQRIRTLASNNTQLRRHLSKHVYQEVPRSSPLSRKAVFHQLAVKAALVQGPDRVSVR